MKTKTLAVLMTALSIGVSPVGIMSASAQDAPIIKKKGAAQTDQSGGATQQQPDASGGAQGSQPGAGAATGGEQTQQPAAGSDVPHRLTVLAARRRFSPTPRQKAARRRPNPAVRRSRTLLAMVPRRAAA